VDAEILADPGGVERVELLCATVLQDLALAFRLVVGRVGLEPTTHGL
jgi:hypothetical protein